MKLAPNSNNIATRNATTKTSAERLKYCYCNEVELKLNL